MQRGVVIEMGTVHLNCDLVVGECRGLQGVVREVVGIPAHGQEYGFRQQAKDHHRNGAQPARQSVFFDAEKDPLQDES